jgi:hypothetical protein
LDRDDREVIFNSLNSLYQDIIPLVNLATQVIEFSQVNKNGFATIQVDFDQTLNVFMNTFRKEAQSIQGIEQRTIFEVFYFACLIEEQDVEPEKSNSIPNNQIEW